MVGRLVRLTQKVWIVASGTIAVALVSVIAAVFEWWWLSVAGITALQLGVMLVSLLGVRPDSARRLDALSARVMAALETERLAASDRHREIVELLERKIGPGARLPLEAERSFPEPSNQGLA